MLNIPDIKFHVSLNAQYEGKLQPSTFHSYNDKNSKLQILNSATSLVASHKATHF